MSVRLLFHHVTSFVQIDQDPISVAVLVDMTYLMATHAEVSKNNSIAALTVYKTL